MPGPFRIGQVTVDPPIVLAPMEDVTNRAFRQIAKRIGGPGLMVTEFVSAMATHYNAERQIDKLIILPDEHPIAVQIFGSDVDVMVEAARRVEASGADICDINMGCWVPKVCKTGAGAALLKQPDHAARLAEAVVRALCIPVTVKVRAGWDYDNLAASALARRFEECGVAAITLHARTARQGFDGKADWRLIRELKQTVLIPVIGNGDVREPADARRMFDETGCDAVMIGRAAISNPWMLGRTSHYLTTGEFLPEPTIEERVSVGLEHLRLVCDMLRSELRGCRHMRGQLPLYVKGFSGAARMREQLSRTETIAEVETVLREALHAPAI